PTRGPQRRPRVADPLDVDVGGGGPAAVVLPAQDGARRPVGNHRPETLVADRSADGDAVRSPQRHAGGAQPLPVDVEVAVAIVLPEKERPSQAIRDDLE